MIVSRILICCTLLCSTLALRIPQTYSRPQLTIYNDGTTGNVSALIQNDKFSMQLDQTFGTKLMYRGIDLVGNASGLYASHGESILEIQVYKVSTSIVSIDVYSHVIKQMGRQILHTHQYRCFTLLLPQLTCSWRHKKGTFILFCTQVCLDGIAISSTKASVLKVNLEH